MRERQDLILKFYLLIRDANFRLGSAYSYLKMLLLKEHSIRELNEVMEAAALL